MRRITLQTFGFKYGYPNANFFFDVSFLSNPARQEEWSLFSPPCQKMRDFVLCQESAQKFIATALPFIETIIMLDDDVRVAIGCNAGRHRSVIIAEYLSEVLEEKGYEVRLKHRELD